jgi:predicted nucleic acid-binding protein
MPASLADYDGAAGTLVDTHVWVDCIDASSPFNAWALDQLQAASERAPLHINVVVYAELLIPQPDPDEVEALLDVYETLRSPMPWHCAALAAAAFRLYRQRGGRREQTLPDFFIGAHAAVANLSVLTRDATPFRSYFKRLKVLAP